MYHLVLIISNYIGEVWNISSRPQTRKYIPPGVDYNQLQSRSLKHFHMQNPLSYQLRTIFGQASAVLGHWPVCDQLGHWPVCDQFGHWPACDQFGHWPACDQFGHWPVCDQFGHWPACDQFGHWPACDQFGHVTSRWPVMMMKCHVCSWSVRAPVDVLGPFLNCKTSPGSTLNEQISSVGRWVWPNLFQNCVRIWSGIGPVDVLRVVSKLQNLSRIDSGRANFIRGSVGQT
jgi:hypothetical protein